MNLYEDPEFGWVYAGPKVLPDGRIAYVAPLLLGRARLNVGDKLWVESGY